MSKKFSKYMQKICNGKESEVIDALGYKDIGNAKNQLKDHFDSFELKVEDAIKVSKIVYVCATDLMYEQARCQLADAGYKEPKQAAAPKAEKTQRDPSPARSPMYVDERPKSGKIISVKL